LLFLSASSVRTPVTRKIVSQEATLASPGGMARSPAMHEGFRSEDWVVKRTPVNTPSAPPPSSLASASAQQEIVVGTLNLSDDEDEEETR